MPSKNFILFFVCVYKMSNEAERLTQKRKITVEKCSENKINTICVNKRGANNLCHMGKNE